MFNCEYCGKHNDAHSVYCCDCGTPLSVAPPVIEQPRVQPKTATRQPAAKLPFPSSMIRVLKRLALAFSLVMVIHAFLAFAAHWPIPPQMAEVLYLGLVWIAPAAIYLVALYGIPVFSVFNTGPLRLVRVAVLTLLAFGLSFGSAISFLGFWFILSMICGFPFREA